MEPDKDYINVEEAVKRVAGNKGLYIRLLHQFIDGNHIAALDEVLASGDMAAAAHNTHSIKGICANLSLTRLHSIAVKLEQLLKNNEDHTAALAELKETYNTTVKQIALVTEQ